MTKLFSKDLGDLVFIYEQESFVTDTTSPTDEGVQESNILALSITEKYRRELSGKSSIFPVGDQTNRSDDFRANPDVFTFNGVVTPKALQLSFFSLNNFSRTPKQYVKKLIALKNSKKLVTIHFPEGLGAANCTLERVTITRDADISDGYKISITAKKKNIANEKVQVIPVTDTATPKAEKGSSPGSNFDPGEDPITADQNLQESAKASNASADPLEDSFLKWLTPEKVEELGSKSDAIIDKIFGG